MPDEEKLKSLALPNALSEQFGLLRKRLFSLETILACSVAVSVFLLSFLVLFVSDRIWETPTSFRWVLSLGAAVLAFAIVLWWAKKWLLKPRNIRSLAMLVQRRYRNLGDRLLGIVELADESKRPPHVSEELYQAAIRQVSDESLKYDFTQAVDSRLSKSMLVVAAALLVMGLIPLLIIPQAGLNTLARLFQPGASIPRFTLVELEELPRELIVPHGENFQVQSKVRYRSFWKPRNASASFQTQPAVSANAEQEKLTFRIPGQSMAGDLNIRLGDVARTVKVLPTHRPALQEISAKVDLPEYLRHEPRTEKLQSGSLTVVEGSFVSIHGKVSRPLKEASIRQGAQTAENLLVQSNQFSTPKLAADGMSDLVFQWADTLGLTNAQSWKLAVQTEKDLPPIPELPDFYREVSILETEVLPIKIRARDDFGVKAFGLAWSSDSPNQDTNAVRRQEFKAETSSETTAERTFNFSPAILKIAADSSAELRAFAVDYYPGRPVVESNPYRIHVIGVSRHAEMVRQNLESLLMQLEEVSRAQEKLAHDTLELKELGKLDSDEAAKKMEELQEAQEQAANNLKQMANEGMKALKDALRNPSFSEDLLSKWTKNLHEMDKVSEQSMKESAKSMQKAQQAQSKEQKEQSLAESKEKQDEALNALQKMQEKVNEGLDDLQALTLAQRLRNLGSEQKEIEGHIQKRIGETIGLTARELPPELTKANQYLSGSQIETAKESGKLQVEISRFYERTKKPNYQMVSTEMNDARTVDELDKVRKMIAENIGMEAMQNLALWSDRFEAWAERLEPKPQEPSEGSGAGQGGGEQKEDTALKQLLGLLRMREKEMNIQQRTKVLNEYLDDKSAYQDGAVLLAASQSKLNRDLTKQAVDNDHAMLDAAYNDAAEAMTEVESLLDKPRTDEPTIAAQDKSVLMLSDLINLLNEQAKNSPSSSSQGEQNATAEEMAFLMQMMAPGMGQGQKPNSAGGGSSAGGTTDSVDMVSRQNAAGKTGEGRAVNKSSGLPQNYPTEFREALQNYFRALEETER
ncbi:MAG: hypothetical protein ACO1QB_12615 [Verrucomicrobiales bacterium]